VTARRRADDIAATDAARSAVLSPAVIGLAQCVGQQRTVRDYLAATEVHTFHVSRLFK
jgi:hypothetical protein